MVEPAGNTACLASDALPVPHASDALPVSHDKLLQGSNRASALIQYIISCLLKTVIFIVQILSACPSLEELTLRSCSTFHDDGSPRDSAAPSHQVPGASAELLTSIERSSTQTRRLLSLRSRQWRRQASRQHAYLDSCVLCDLAGIPSVVVHADSVMLFVPERCDKVPVSLKIVTTDLQLAGCDFIDELNADLASFCSRCQLAVEGVCLETVIAKWAPSDSRRYHRW